MTLTPDEILLEIIDDYQLEVAVLISVDKERKLHVTGGNRSEVDGPETVMLMERIVDAVKAHIAWMTDIGGRTLH